MSDVPTAHQLFRLVVDGKPVRGGGLYLPAPPAVGDVLTTESGGVLVVEAVRPLVDGSYAMFLVTQAR